MASLAQYSAALQQHDAAARPVPGPGTRIAGALIYASVFALVAIAGLLQAG